MKKIIIWSFIFMGIVIGIVIGKPIGKKIASDDHYKELNYNINKDLPTMIDDMTRLDRVKAAPHNYTYNYTLVKQTNLKILKNRLYNHVCSNYKEEIAQGISYKHIYTNNHNETTYTFVINQAACQDMIPKEWDLEGLKKDLNKIKNKNARGISTGI